MSRGPGFDSDSMAAYYTNVADDWPFDDWFELPTGPGSFNADDHCQGEPRGTWVRATGEPIRYRDMTDGHLRNTIKFIERNEADYRSSRVYRGLRRELARRTKQRGDYMIKTGRRTAIC